MQLAFSETLSGGVRPAGSSQAVQALTLDLEASARGVVECALGAPFAIRGSLRSEAPRAGDTALLPRHASVHGTLRFHLSSGLFYDLRVSADADTAPREKLELRGARRFVRGDLFTSSTTFDGVLVRRGEPIGDVRLRFDVRDDVPRLLRSFRLGG